MRIRHTATPGAAALRSPGTVPAMPSTPMIMSRSYAVCCVKEMTLDAVRLGFPTTLLTDGIPAVNLSPGDGDHAVADMVAAGVVVE